MRNETVKVFNHQRQFMRHTTPRLAIQLIAKGEAFDSSRWVHGKGRTEFQVTMFRPEREASHSPAAISFTEAMINAGAGKPGADSYVSNRREKLVQDKVEAWGEMTEEFRQEITVHAEMLGDSYRA